MLKQLCDIIERCLQRRHWARTLSQALSGCGREMRLQIGIIKGICQVQALKRQEMGALNSFTQFLLPV